MDGSRESGHEWGWTKCEPGDQPEKCKETRGKEARDSLAVAR